MKASSLSLAVASGAVVGAIALAAPHAVAQSQTTLTIATVNNPQMVDMAHAVGDFEKQSGIRVRFETLPENTLRQKVTADVATGGGQFDVATVGTYEDPIWAKNKWIVDLQPRFDKLDSKAKADYDLADIIPNIRKGLSYNGALYAVPFYGESSMTFYNKKAFADAHLVMPEHPTWGSDRWLCEKTTRAGEESVRHLLARPSGLGRDGRSAHDRHQHIRRLVVRRKVAAAVHGRAHEIRDRVLRRSREELWRARRDVGRLHGMRDELHARESCDVGRCDVGSRRG